MTEQTNPPGDTPQQEQPTAERAAPPPRRPPHEEEAPPEVLDPRGEAVAKLLHQVASPHMVASGGRDETPWIEVRPEQLVEVASHCQESPELQMEMLHCMLAVDYMDHLQMVYILASLSKGHKAMLKVRLDIEHPRVPSLTSLWEAAGWYERETHDLFGVEFEGNPDLSPLLLYEGFEGFPGRKSFPFHEYEEY
jgi:NADH-quinone oxidoreductase subunit C